MKRFLSGMLSAMVLVAGISITSLNKEKIDISNKTTSKITFKSLGPIWPDPK